MTAGLTHFDKPPVGVWVSLNRVLLTLIVLTTLGVTLYRFNPREKFRSTQLEQIAQLRATVDLQKQHLARAKRELELLHRDPEYLELIAREPLHLQKPGERVYRLQDDKVRSAAPPKPSPKKAK